MKKLKKNSKKSNKYFKYTIIAALVLFLFYFICVLLINLHYIKKIKIQYKEPITNSIKLIVSKKNPDALYGYFDDTMKSRISKTILQEYFDHCTDKKELINVEDFNILPSFFIPKKGEVSIPINLKMTMEKSPSHQLTDILFLDFYLKSDKLSICEIVYIYGGGYPEYLAEFIRKKSSNILDNP